MEILSEYPAEYIDSDYVSKCISKLFDSNLLYSILFYLIERK